MAVTSLELLKQHVRADDFADDDEYLLHLLDAAELSIVHYTNRSLADLLELGGGKDFPADLTHAILLICGHWYNQRESVSAQQMHAVPHALESLIRPYRVLITDTSDTEE